MKNSRTYNEDETIKMIKALLNLTLIASTMGRYENMKDLNQEIKPTVASKFLSKIDVNN